MKRITDEIKKLADEELAWAVKNYGYFHSLHEGNGKLMEELDEAKSEIEIAEILMDDLWDRVKCGDDERAVDYAKDIAKRAILASAELVQVSAVAMKIVESESEDGKKYWKKIKRLTADEINNDIKNEQRRQAEAYGTAQRIGGGKNIKYKIHELRGKWGMSQAEFADKIHISGSTVSGWERGKAVPSTNMLYRIAKAFGVSVAWLLEEEESTQSNRAAEKNINPIGIVK